MPPPGGPERSSSTAADALLSGQPFGRLLSYRERLCLGVVATGPTHHLTLDSEDLTRSGMSEAWVKFLKRLNRKKSNPRPLMYLAHPAVKTGARGYHLHVLLWEFLYLPMVIKAASATGFGGPHITQIPDFKDDLRTSLHMVAYVLGQEDEVFGVGNDGRHRPRPPHKRNYLYPSRRTLAVHSPTLLSAIQQAGDRSLSDGALCEALPMFSKVGKLGKGDG